MVVFPNAKINIGLKIVEKRADGFHNIESVFFPVFDLCDVLEIIKDDTLDHVVFQSTGIDIPGDNDQNLCVKAFELLRNDFDITHVKIHLHKIIPIGAGLGGGSSDAAFTLILLNDMFELNLSKSQLIDYARKLGSDCAFFIENKPVYAFEKGDVFNDVDLNLDAYKIEIIYPGTHISTAEAYSGVVPKISKNKLTESIQLPLLNWKDKVVNDFELSIFPNHAKIKKAKEDMYEKGAIYASMTGSGSAVYGIFEN